MATADPADLALALRLADRADAITLNSFRSTELKIETKPDLTPVTEADRTVESVLTEMIGRSRPDDAVLGEEYGLTGTSDRCWVIDPIDGTKNFVRHIPVWATLIALEQGGAVTVGVASAPALGRRWWAGRGLGAFAGVGGSVGEPIRVSGISSLADAQVCYSTLTDWDGHGRGIDGLIDLARNAWRSRALGDFWSHVLVAEGACEIGLDPVASHWDLAALQVIVEEAGGTFSDLSGRERPDGGSAISSNGLLHDEARHVLVGP